jgi:hypothetical protein
MFGFTKTTVIAIIAMVNAAPVAEAENVHVLETRLKRTGRMTWFNVGLGNCKFNPHTIPCREYESSHTLFSPY